MKGEELKVVKTFVTAPAIMKEHFTVCTSYEKKTTGI
jgi:hypothetical protein